MSLFADLQLLRYKKLRKRWANGEPAQLLQSRNRPQKKVEKLLIVLTNPNHNFCREICAKKKENIIKLNRFNCNLYRAQPAHIQKRLFLLVKLCYEHSTLDIEPLHVRLHTDRALINDIRHSKICKKCCMCEAR